MFEHYKIAVRLSIVDELSGPLALIVRHLYTTEAAAMKLQNRLKSIKTLFAGGSAMIGAGAAVAAPLLYAIDKAAELQKQLIGVQIASRGTTAQMDAMRAAIERTAGQTIFSNIDVAKMAKLIATGTGLGAEQTSSLLPVFARFADVQSLMKGTAFEESVTNLIRLAHTAQHYNAQELTHYADMLTKASFIVPGGLGEVGHALKYSQGIAKTALGIDDDNMVLLTALLNRLGLSGSRGGTNLLAAMTRTIPGIFGSGLLTGKSNQALLAMGMVDSQGHARVFKDGKFDPVTWMGLMSAYVQREFARHPEAMARQDIMKNFQHAFGVQGSRVASLLSSPQAIDQWRQIGEIFAQYGGVEAIQQRFANESVSQQYQNAKTNFISAMTEAGITLLPLATTALQKFNGYMKELIDWMTKNPEKVKEYATNIGYFAVALASLGAISVATSGILGLVTAIGALRAASAATLGAAGAGGAKGLLGKVGAVGGAFGIGYSIGSLVDAGISWGISKATGHDATLGTWFYDLTHRREDAALAIPSSLQQRRGAIERPAQTTSRDNLAPRTRAQTPTYVQVHSSVNLDSQKIGDVVTRHIGKMMSRPHGGTGDFDGRSMLSPAGGIGDEY